MKRVNRSIKAKPVAGGIATESQREVNPVRFFHFFSC
jgi:hypothetical protein